MAHLHISGEYDEETKGDIDSVKKQLGYGEEESMATAALSSESTRSHSEGGSSQKRSDSEEDRCVSPAPPHALCLLALLSLTHTHTHTHTHHHQLAINTNTNTNTTIDTATNANANAATTNTNCFTRGAVSTVFYTLSTITTSSASRRQRNAENRKAFLAKKHAEDEEKKLEQLRKVKQKDESLEKELKEQNERLRSERAILMDHRRNQIEEYYHQVQSLATQFAAASAPVSSAALRWGPRLQPGQASTTAAQHQPVPGYPEEK